MMLLPKGVKVDIIGHLAKGADGILNTKDQNSSFRIPIFYKYRNDIYRLLPIFYFTRPAG